MNLNELELIVGICNAGAWEVAKELVKRQEGNIVPLDACIIANALDINYLKDVVGMFPDVGEVNDFRAKVRIALAKEFKTEKEQEHEI